jgi:NtrC-family two-component system sensor histidine kinase KinB
MKLRSKIQFGFGVVFIIVLSFRILSVLFVNQQSNSAENIFKNNYETLSFAKDMRAILDEGKIPLSLQAKSAFNQQLSKQEHNITEKGEDGATVGLRTSFEILRSSQTSFAQQENAVHDARFYLRKIEELNLRAILVNTNKAQTSVNRAVLILGAIGCIAFLALFSLSFNMSNLIASPLVALVNGLEEISHGNYDYQLDLDKHDEFGKVVTAFNNMAENLIQKKQKQNGS